MKNYQVEQICLFCRHFSNCENRSIDGTCEQWISELCLNSLMEVIRLDDIVMSSKDPICREYKEKALKEKETIEQYFQELKISRMSTFNTLSKKTATE